MTKRAIHRLVVPMGFALLLQGCQDCPDPPQTPAELTGNSGNCNWIRRNAADTTSFRLLVCIIEGIRVTNDTSGVGEG